MAAVSQHDVLHVTDAFAVDEHAPGGNRFGPAGTARIDCQHVTIFQQESVFRSHAGRLGQSPMLDQMAVFTVHGDEVPRADQPEHQLEFLLTGMSGHVNPCPGGVVHLGAAPVDVVDHVADRSLVAWNDAGREDHRVVRLHVDLPVITNSDANQRRQRFALAAGGEQRDLVRRQVLQLIQIREEGKRELQIAELRGNLDAGVQAAADRNHAAPMALGELDDLRQAVDVRRKR
jgi:hypothetical protein